MDEEQVYKLFDFFWFNHFIFDKENFSLSDIDPNKRNQETQIPKPVSLSRLQHVRSRSHESIPQVQRLHLNSPSRNPKLETILSGKQDFDRTQVDSERTAEKPRKMILRRRKRTSKSLSDLEFEELKGFMDLGFTFSSEETDPEMISIIPGLQRLGKKNGEGDVSGESSISRPYLSEAWNGNGNQKSEYSLRNWKIPSVEDGIAMKDNLKFWARTVASTVR